MLATLIMMVLFDAWQPRFRPVRPGRTWSSEPSRCPLNAKAFHFPLASPSRAIITLVDGTIDFPLRHELATLLCSTLTQYTSQLLFTTEQSISSARDRSPSCQSSALCLTPRFQVPGKALHLAVGASSAFDCGASWSNPSIPVHISTTSGFPMPSARSKSFLSS